MVTHILAGLAWAMDNIGDLTAYALVAVAGVGLGWGTFRAMRPSRWPTIAPYAIDSTWAVRTLRQQLRADPAGAYGEVMVAGVLVSAHRLRNVCGFDYDCQPRWRVRVGPHEQDVPDVETVALVVVGRLQAIADERSAANVRRLA